MVGQNDVLTFDGSLLHYEGSCEYVLAADLPYNRWAITVKYNKFTPKIINVYIDGRIVEFSKQFKVSFSFK